jgi:hypothetical protein
VYEKSISSKEETMLENAMEIASIKYTAGRQAIKPPVDESRVFGQLFAFTDEEVSQLGALRDLIVRYAGERSPTRPLCLAIFGSPGSGKSFAVKQIRKVAEEKIKDPKLKLPLTVINLTQVSGSVDIGRVIGRIAGEQDEDTIPIIFFDEFDAPRDSAPFGWLQWFLAPMHDGEFLHDGAVIRLKRAIYVFAGGTAYTMAEFSSRNGDIDFRDAKGPDFISRLRGYLDVQGPNSEPRALRRAIILRNELQERIIRGKNKEIEPDTKLVRALLEVGRYRHGARSIAAIVELSDLGSAHFGWNELPEDHLLSLHVDRGPLDSRLIGGTIALSGYPIASYSKDDVTWCWLFAARQLWREGATLSYAGSWEKGVRGDLMKHLANDLKKLPVEPSRTLARRDAPSPWLVSFLKKEGREQLLEAINQIMKPEEQSRYGLQLITTDFLSDQERDECDQWSAKVVERFRRRLAVTESSVARFAVAGATTDFDGRVPGIAEELMLTLALGKPIYVAGGFGGAALDCGTLLGLAGVRSGEIPPSLKPQTDETKLMAIKEKLQPGPWTSLPLTAAEIASFLKEYALGGPRWPDNGLNADENRRLFSSKEPEEVATLLIKGLRQCFGVK